MIPDPARRGNARSADLARNHLWRYGVILGVMRFAALSICCAAAALVCTGCDNGHQTSTPTTTRPAAQSVSPPRTTSPKWIALPTSRTDGGPALTAITRGQLASDGRCFWLGSQRQRTD